MCFGSLFLPVFIIKCKFLGTPKFAFLCMFLLVFVSGLLWHSLVPLRFVSCLCCHPTYLKQVLVPPAWSNAALARQNPNHLPTHLTKSSRNNFAPSKHPVGWKGTCGALMCFDVLCSLLACVTCFRDSLAWSWPGCVIGYGRGKFLRHPLIERKQDETLGRQTPQE